MYPRITLLLLLVLVATFFYLHTTNPGEVRYVISAKWTVALPVTVLIFVGFFVGVAVAVFNSLFFDARRAIRDLRARREQKSFTNSMAEYRSGSAELLRGRSKKARSHLEKALAAAPGDVDKILRLAELFTSDALYQDAGNVLDEGLAKNPGSVEILSALAALTSRTGDRKGAEKFFGQLLDDYGDNGAALVGIREIKAGAALWDEAADIQRRLVALEKGGVKGGDKKSAEERALLCGYLYESAKAAYDFKVGDSGAIGSPDNSPHSSNDNSDDKALEKSTEALKVDDRFVPAYILSGDIHYRAGRIDEALRVWEGAFKKLHHHALFLKVEEVFMKGSDPRKILDRYESAITADPDDATLKLMHARLYLKLEMVDDAMAVLDRLSSEGEEGFYHQVLLGEAFARREDTRKVSALLKAALGLDKELTPPFQCSCCDRRLPGYAARCPSCARWSTFVMSVDFPPGAERADLAGGGAGDGGGEPHTP